MHFRYDQFKTRDILHAIFPAEGDEEYGVAPTGYCQIGHIIQLNLRDHQLPYKKIIGQVNIYFMMNIEIFFLMLLFLKTDYCLAHYKFENFMKLNGGKLSLSEN